MNSNKQGNINRYTEPELCCVFFFPWWNPLGSLRQGRGQSKQDGRHSSKAGQEGRGQCSKSVLTNHENYLGFVKNPSVHTYCQLSWVIALCIQVQYPTISSKREDRHYPKPTEQNTQRWCNKITEKEKIYVNHEKFRLWEISMNVNFISCPGSMLMAWAITSRTEL